MPLATCTGGGTHRGHQSGDAGSKDGYIVAQERGGRCPGARDYLLCSICGLGPWSMGPCGRWRRKFERWLDWTRGRIRWDRDVRGDVPGTDTNGSAAVLVLLATSQRIALTWGQEEASAAAAAAVAKAPSPTPAPLPKGGWEMLLAEIENVEFGDGEVAVRSKKGVTMRAKCIDGEARRLDQFCQRLLLVLGTSPRGESGGN